LNKNKLILVLGLLIFGILIGLVLVFAKSHTPDGLIFSSNDTATGDSDGKILLNWTAGIAGGDGDNVANYSIYISSNGGTNWYLKATNDSELGYTFSNTTNGNYTFKVTAVNDTGDESTNSSILFNSVDTTGPVITLPIYINGTAKKNTETNFTLNISVSDADSGLVGSMCKIDINGTNYTLSVSNGWVNTSDLDLIGLSDGNQTINVWCNDTFNHGTLNNSYVVQVDTTNPSVVILPTYTNATFKRNNQQLTLNISVTDATSGLNSCVINVNGTNQTVSATRGTGTINWCNSSAISLTNLADGNQTIKIWANDSAGNSLLNSSYVVQVDTTGPIMNLPVYVNGTAKKNTQNLTINISLTDGGSGLTGTGCIINANGTNKTITSNSNWCNDTISLTNLADGNQTIYIYTNDTLNNWRLNSSYVVQVDTTAPVPAYSCTYSTVSASEPLSCTCTSTAATSGIADLSFTSTPSTSTEGTFSVMCTTTDNAGNSATKNVSYTVIGSGGNGGSSGGGSSSSTSYWQNTIIPDNEQINQGYTNSLAVKSRIKLTIKQEIHYLGVVGLTDTTALINVSSTSQQATLKVGDSRRFELNTDGYYDLLVTLNSIDSITKKANITVLTISEKITQEVASQQQVQEQTAAQQAQEEIETQIAKKGLDWWVWVIMGVVLLIIILAVVFSGKKNKRK